MIPVNTILQTKDGRKFGNAIIQSINLPYPDTHLIRTDYGNEMRLKEQEIRTLFFIGPLATPSHKHYSTTH